MHLPLTKQLNWKNGIKGQRFEGIMRRTDGWTDGRHTLTGSNFP